MLLYFDTTLQVKCNFEVTSFSAWYLLLMTLVLCALFKHSQKMSHFQVAHINFECCMKVKQHFSLMVWQKVPSRILIKTFQTFKIITHISKLAYETCESDIERINLM